MRLTGQLSMGLVINCNYIELHVTCWMGCLIESKAMSIFNCGNEINRSAKWMSLVGRAEQNQRVTFIDLHVVFVHSKYLLAKFTNV